MPANGFCGGAGGAKCCGLEGQPELPELMLSMPANGGRLLQHGSRRQGRAGLNAFKPCLAPSGAMFPQVKLQNKKNANNPGKET